MQCCETYCMYPLLDKLGSILMWRKGIKSASNFLKTCSSQHPFWFICAGFLGSWHFFMLRFHPLALLGTAFLAISLFIYEIDLFLLISLVVYVKGISFLFGSNPNSEYKILKVSMYNFLLNLSFWQPPIAKSDHYLHVCF